MVGMCAIYSSFNPRPRDGGDEDEKPDNRPMGVSIRAPVMGATAAALDGGAGKEVSIRAPVMGATRGQRQAQPGVPVSIRAPVMGATTVRVHPDGRWQFQSAPP